MNKNAVGCPVARDQKFDFTPVVRLYGYPDSRPWPGVGLNRPNPCRAACDPAARPRSSGISFPLADRRKPGASTMMFRSCGRTASPLRSSGRRGKGTSWPSSTHPQTDYPAGTRHPRTPVGRLSTQRRPLTWLWFPAGHPTSMPSHRLWTAEAGEPNGPAARRALLAGLDTSSRCCAAAPPRRGQAWSTRPNWTGPTLPRRSNRWARQRHANSPTGYRRS
jgi:hypothetical protein